MKRSAVFLLSLSLAADAQSGARASWSAMSGHDSSRPILHTVSTNSVASPYAPGGKERPWLTLFCGVGSVPTVEFSGHFQLSSNDGAVVIDGQTLSVDWQLNDDKTAMTAAKSDIEGLAYRMRHGKEMMVIFQTTGGPSQYAVFSLTGLDALMSRTACN